VAPAVARLGAALARSHQIHHSPQRIDISGSTLFHPVEMVVQVAAADLRTVIVLGLDPLAAALVGYVAAFHGLFQHWNVATPRWLGVLIQRPEAHCEHHRLGVHANNYGDLPIWDLLFGTFRNPARFEGDAASSRPPTGASGDARLAGRQRAGYGDGSRARCRRRAERGRRGEQREPSARRGDPARLAHRCNNARCSSARSAARPQVSPICLGGNVFGWTVDEALSFRLLDAWVDAGMNFIDTADVYSRWVHGHAGGESETILGKWFRQSGKRNRVVLATKVGMAMGDTTPTRACRRPTSARRRGVAAAPAAPT
jgi:hypothetical protein